MVSDATLQKIALGTTCIGIVSLFILSLVLEPGVRQLDSISESDVGKTMTVSGTVAHISKNSVSGFTMLSKNTSLNAVILDKNQQAFLAFQSLHSGDQVTIIGKIVLYKGELELVATSIKPLKV